MAASRSRIDLAPPAGVCCDCWSWLVVFVFYVLLVCCVLCVMAILYAVRLCCVLCVVVVC